MAEKINRKLLLTNVAGIFVGTYLPKILNRTYGMVINEEGVRYYAEVHTNWFNSIIHTLFMPSTVSGALMWAPVALGMNARRAAFLRLFLYTAFMTHYIQINGFVGLVISLIYSESVLQSIRVHDSFSQNETFIEGLKHMTLSLFIQEIVGHALTGDPPSRPEAIPNAILYAIYYSVSHLFTRYN